jgi:hypothetical protein
VANTLLALRFRAGAAAYREIRAHGFDPSTVQTLVGASGGAKWLVLSQLDRVLIRRLVADRRTPLHLIGSSIGAWRFACYARRDPLAAIARLENAYLEQRYGARPSSAEVSAQSRAILAAMLGESGVAEILSHPSLHLHVVATRCRGPTASTRRRVLMAGLGIAAGANALDRRLLGVFFVRTLFHDARLRPPFEDAHGLTTKHVVLTADNLEDCILASGAIPLVLDGVRDIAGAPSGVYRDGGIVDYHFDAVLADEGRIALYPHFYGHVAPGWFDKHWPSRRARPGSLERVLLIHPSEEFVATLPWRRLPDRRDFGRLADEERLRGWRNVIEKSRRLADELDAAWDEALAGRLEPL